MNEITNEESVPAAEQFVNNDVVNDSVREDSYADTEQNKPEVNPEADEKPKQPETLTNVLPTITCGFSENPVFETGKTYSVAEFDRIIREADKKHTDGRKEALRFCGSEDAWNEAEIFGKDDKFKDFIGYNKVYFTVNMPNGSKITVRQDIGDDYGGIIDYMRHFEKFSPAVEILETAEKPVENLTNDKEKYSLMSDESAIGIAEPASVPVEDIYIEFSGDKDSILQIKDFALSLGRVVQTFDDTRIGVFADSTITDGLTAMAGRLNVLVSKKNSAQNEQEKEASEPEASPQAQTVSEPPEKPENYRIKDYNLADSLKGMFRDNINAIKTLFAVESEGRQATAAEQEALARYVGWGGLAEAFDEHKNGWTKEYKELKELLSDEQYKSARASTLDSFYTQPVIIEAMYKALQNMGFEGGRILDIRIPTLIQLYFSFDSLPLAG